MFWSQRYMVTTVVETLRSCIISLKLYSLKIFEPWDSNCSAKVSICVKSANPWIFNRMLSFFLRWNPTTAFTRSKLISLLFPTFIFVASLASRYASSFPRMPIRETSSAEHRSCLTCPFLSVHVGCLKVVLGGLYLLPLRQL